ncbi:hypothetical protein HDU76_001508 [Blyttiomyces sp. JEL0837]|nr:hypothetical protein HDU76_001508 [Blyttiomyces sp. JEL0837]
MSISSHPSTPSDWPPDSTIRYIPDYEWNPFVTADIISKYHPPQIPYEVWSSNKRNTQLPDDEEADIWMDLPILFPNNYIGILHTDNSDCLDPFYLSSPPSSYDLHVVHELNIDAQHAGNQARFVNDFRGVPMYCGKWGQCLEGHQHYPPSSDGIRHGGVVDGGTKNELNKDKNDKQETLTTIPQRTRPNVTFDSYVDGRTGHVRVGMFTLSRGEPKNYYSLATDSTRQVQYVKYVVDSALSHVGHSPTQPLKASTTGFRFLFQIAMQQYPLYRFDGTLQRFDNDALKDNLQALNIPVTEQNIGILREYYISAYHYQRRNDRAAADICKNTYLANPGSFASFEFVSGFGDCMTNHVIIPTNDDIDFLEAVATGLINDKVSTLERIYALGKRALLELDRGNVSGHLERFMQVIELGATVLPPERFCFTTPNVATSVLTVQIKAKFGNCPP